MSRTALEVKATRKPKFSTRGYNRVQFAVVHEAICVILVYAVLF